MTILVSRGAVSIGASFVPDWLVQHEERAEKRGQLDCAGELASVGS